MQVRELPLMSSKRRLPWSDIEVALLREFYPWVKTAIIAGELGRSVSSVYDKADNMGLKKNPIYLASKEAQRQRIVANRNTRFQPGQSPWNKGMKGLDIGGKATRFKPGNRPHTWQPIGHTRTTKDDYLQRKMADTGCTRRDYVPIHHLVWRMHGGTIPRGHALVFRDGNARNFDINNLELVTRAELMRRNSVHRYPKPIVALIQLRGALNRQINRRTRTTP
jgi:hypothetical protein